MEAGQRPELFLKESRFKELQADDNTVRRDSFINKVESRRRREEAGNGISVQMFDRDTFKATDTDEKRNKITKTAEDFKRT